MSKAPLVQAASLNLLSVAGLPHSASESDVIATLAAHTNLGDAAAVSAAVLAMSIQPSRDGKFAMAYVAFHTKKALEKAAATQEQQVGGRLLTMRVARQEHRETFARC